MEYKIKLCIRVPELKAQIEHGFYRLGVKTEIVDESNIDSQTVFVGKTADISNRKYFNLSGYSIALNSGVEESPWSDENIESCFSSDDYEHFIPALVFARQFGDVDDSVLPKIKKFLAKNYSMDGEWTAHADKEIWTDTKTAYMTVRIAIARLIRSSTTE